MKKDEWADLFGSLLEMGLDFAPRDEETAAERIKAWYPFLADYNTEEVENAIFSWIINHKRFPKISDIIKQIENRRSGIDDLRIYMTEKQQEKEQMKKEAHEKRKGMTAKEVLEFNKTLKEDIKYDPIIQKCIDAFGGDLDEIKKYHMKEMREIYHRLKRKERKKRLMNKVKLLKDKE